MKESLAMGTLFLHHPDKMFNSHCVISCHGGYRPGCCGEDTFDVPAGVDLVFYSEHGKSVTDFGIDNFLSKTHRAKETLSRIEARRQNDPKLRRCYNYTLTKFQARNKHWWPSSNKGRGTETYDSIQNAVTKNERMNASLNSFLETATKFRQGNITPHDDDELRLLAPESRSDEIELGEQVQFEFPFDVLTVRNRFYNGTVTLKAAINAALGVHRYRTFHCYFCRS
jgi:hypothetical protein